MPFATNAGARIYWRLFGRDGAPAIVMLNSIATDQSMFDPVVERLLEEFQMLRVDTRGHGASDATPGDYTLDLLADDVLRCMDSAGIQKAILCGVSLGGMMAMTLALKAPERVSALMPACTSAFMGGEFWGPRIAKVRAEGVASIADAALGRFLAPDFAAKNPGVADTVRRGILATDSEGYAGCGAAIMAMDLIPHLARDHSPDVGFGRSAGFGDAV